MRLLRILKVVSPFNHFQLEGQFRLPFSKALVNSFKQALMDRGLSSSSINIRLSALRKLALEASDNNLMDGNLAAVIGRIKGAKNAGVRLGNWLSKPQAERLIDTPPRTTFRGKRDRAIFGVMIGAGLRRNEIADLCTFHLQQREGRWLIADLSGKGNKVRSVPIAWWTKL